MAARKKVEAPPEPPKGKRIQAAESPDGVGVVKSILQVIQKAKKKGAKFQAIVDAVAAKFPDREVTSTVRSQLGGKTQPIRLELDTKSVLEVSEGTLEERTYTFVREATEEEIAERKAAKKEKKAAKKASAAGLDAPQDVKVNPNMPDEVDPEDEEDVPEPEETEKKKKKKDKDKKKDKKKNKDK